MTETLTDVEESYRSDDEFYLRKLHDGQFMLATHDETMTVKFDDVSAYIVYGSEWADFYSGELNFHVCEEVGDFLPHWVYEELSHIEQEGELRPTDDYETTYQLKENRGIKGREE